MTDKELSDIGGASDPFHIPQTTVGRALVDEERRRRERDAEQARREAEYKRKKRVAEEKQDSWTG